MLVLPPMGLQTNRQGEAYAGNLEARVCFVDVLEDGSTGKRDGGEGQEGSDHGDGLQHGNVDLLYFRKL